MDISGLQDSLVQLSAIEGGRMVFADVRGFGLIEQSSKLVRLQDIVALNWQDRLSVLRVSADGKKIQMDASKPARTVRFSLTDRVVSINPPPDSSLASVITDSPRVHVANWTVSFHPTLNGKPLNIAANERALRLAFVPGTDDFVLGCDYYVYLFDANGKNLWTEDLALPGAAWGVNVTADGRWVVVAFVDGTIRWLRLSDGKEVLALFVHPDGQRWVAWTPQGYYDASIGGDDLLGWQVNRGYDDAPDFFPASQFREQFYRPDVIARVLDTRDPAVAVREADQAAGRKTAKPTGVATLLTPVVQVMDPVDGSPADRREFALIYSARMPTNDPILRVEALVDGTRVEASDKELLTQGDTRVGKLEFKLPQHDAKVSAIAYNINGASEPASIGLRWCGPGVDTKPTLYVLAIGIGSYKCGDTDKDLNLRYAAKDARDFVAAVERQERGLYENIVSHVLQDQDAMQDKILDELDWIKREVTSYDVAMVFISGHGIKTPDQRYGLLPYDYDPDRRERTTIPDWQLQQYLANMGGKTLFFFDTCYSAGVLGKSPGFHPDVDKFANELRAAENGVVVFASSTGNQLSREDDEWKNGAFTRALVEGFGGVAARPEMHAISVSDMEGYVARRVKDLTKGNQTPMTAKPKTIEDFWIAAVRQLPAVY